MIRDGILRAVGQTPLVALRRLFADAPFELFGKIEGLNPGGSAKDRSATAIIEAALDSKRITPETVVVESSSGNMGIGLAQACLYHGLRFICVIDPKTSKQTLKILETYGADIELVDQRDPATGEYLPARLTRVRSLLDTLDHVFWPNQYVNTENSNAHYRTMAEIATALGGELDYLFCGTSTCGTIRGCGEYVRDHSLQTKVIAVDAEGSCIFGAGGGHRKLPGLGAAMKPGLCAPEFIDAHVHVSDMDCILGCRRLLKTEAILAGASSGGVVAAVNRWIHSIESGAKCVLILPDRGERYLDTVYSDTWVNEVYGDIEQTVSP